MGTKATFVSARVESTEISIDGVEVRRLEGREAISEPFAFDVDIDVREGSTFDIEAALGAAVSIVFTYDEEEVRRVHGVVGSIVVGHIRHDRVASHRIRVVPRIHRLTLSASCEVFLERSVIDIARDKLGRVGITPEDIAAKLTHPPDKREFRLQYAESDLVFVSRILERAGVAYWFDHSGKRDVVVLSDHNDAFPHAAGPEALLYTGSGRGDERGIVGLRRHASMMTARHVVHDYDPNHPSLDLRSQQDLDAPFGGEVVEFCAGYTTKREGQALARRRAEAHRMEHDGLEGECNVPHVEAARRIAVEGHPLFDARRLLVLWAEHTLQQTTFMHGDVEVTRPNYECRFRAIPSEWHYTPAYKTPWPRVAGLVHAVTEAAPEGASGRIAQLDEQGRYTVRFHFDNADQRHRKVSSARVRMMQSHAGPGYGMHFPLKPGVEVYVAFVEGDPDRPILVGAVPNPLTASPVTAANAQMNRIQTESGIRITMKDG
jgi:type VI secretion system secreted protein VgrG